MQIHVYKAFLTSSVVEGVPHVFISLPHAPQKTSPCIKIRYHSEQPHTILMEASPYIQNIQE